MKIIQKIEEFYFISFIFRKLHSRSTVSYCDIFPFDGTLALLKNKFKKCTAH